MVDSITPPAGAGGAQTRDSDGWTPEVKEMAKQTVFMNIKLFDSVNPSSFSAMMNNLMDANNAAGDPFNDEFDTTAKDAQASLDGGGMAHGDPSGKA